MTVTCLSKANLKICAFVSLPEKNKCITVLGLNCFMVPSLFSLKKENKNCRFQPQRSKGIGLRCLKEDISILQGAIFFQAKQLSQSL